MDGAQPLIDIAARLADEVDALAFSEPVVTTYNPLRYAWEPHRAYLERFGAGPVGRTVWLGMNPGPWGMAQTGVPFGEVAAVRDWMGLSAPVHQPPSVHPKRPILGFEHPRSEVSGRRLWGWAAERFGTAEAFFADHFVLNYCPLVFMKATGANHVPEKLPKAEREPLFAACDRALRDTIAVLRPRHVVGVGAFAESCARRVVPEQSIGRVLHPSPASPAANRGWAPAAERQLLAQGVTLPT